MIGTEEIEALRLNPEDFARESAIEERKHPASQDDLRAFESPYVDGRSFYGIWDGCFAFTKKLFS